MSFHDLAELLLPADGDGAICVAGSDWNVEPVELTAGERSVWGCEPTWTPAGPGLVQYAARRERALARLRTRPPGRLSVAGVHRWSPSFVQARRLPRTLSWLRGGLLVELTTDVSIPRVIDIAATAAGLTQRAHRLHFGAGDQINARGQLEGGEQTVLRVARRGSPADPLRAADALALLEPLALPHVPRLLERGEVGGVAWTTETLLPGRRPDALSLKLAVEVADFCARLPRSAGPPTAFASDIASLIDWLPQQFREPLRELETRAEPVIATLPAVLRHGDLWAGNLLVEDGSLSGVVDWDAWQPSSVPGTDLFHLVASAHTFSTRQTAGDLMRERPWELPLFTEAAKGYWRELGIAPTRETLEAIGIAWWTMHTTGNLRRHPHMANDEQWLRTSVESLLGHGMP